MKLPITDQFLWIIYKFFEETGEILEPPEIFKLKGWKNILPLGTEVWKDLAKKKNKRQFAQFINHLKNKGYIKIANLKKKKGILLTPTGERKILKVKFELLDKKRRKDKKWIMIMYDIPEKKRRERSSLRVILQSLGYQNFQKSIWICPYDVFQETEEIIRIHSLDHYIKTFLIEEIVL
ncbi:MAG: CRISPR-associated endonuclease Cas2 [Patescibacteria group bacterium]|nr:CRISPR-associated endonuclease Cas2 [Patescibacteria group bacterium]